MSKALIINFVVFRDGLDIASGNATIFGSETYSKLMVRILDNIRAEYSGCNVYANSVNIIK